MDSARQTFRGPSPSLHKPTSGVRAFAAAGSQGRGDDRLEGGLNSDGGVVLDEGRPLDDDLASGEGLVIEDGEADLVLKADLVVETPDDGEGTGAGLAEPAGEDSLCREVPLFDEAEFKAFVCDQHKLVRRHAYLLRLSRADTEDILQQSLVVLFKARELVPSKCWKSFLEQTMFLRKLSMLARFRTSKKRVAETAWLAEDWGRRTSPEYDVLRKEYADTFVEMLQKLPPQQREVVRLHLIDGLSLSEAAKVLNVVPATAKSWWWRAWMELGREAQRRDEKGRNNVAISAFVASMVSLLVAFFRRLVRRRSRAATGLVASAACALLVLGHDGPAEGLGEPGLVAVYDVDAIGLDAAELNGGDRDGTTRVSLTRSPLEYAFAPIVSMLAAPSSTAALPRKHRVAKAERSLMPRRLLVSAAAALAAGELQAARAFLSEYKGTYPHNPFPEQYAKIAANVGVP